MGRPTREETLAKTAKEKAERLAKEEAELAEWEKVRAQTLLSMMERMAKIEWDVSIKLAYASNSDNPEAEPCLVFEDFFSKGMESCLPVHCLKRDYEDYLWQLKTKEDQIKKAKEAELIRKTEEAKRESLKSQARAKLTDEEWEALQNR